MKLRDVILVTSLISVILFSSCDNKKILEQEIAQLKDSISYLHVKNMTIEGAYKFKENRYQDTISVLKDHNKRLYIGYENMRRNLLSINDALQECRNKPTEVKTVIEKEPCPEPIESFDYTNLNVKTPNLDLRYLRVDDGSDPNDIQLSAVYKYEDNVRVEIDRHKDPMNKEGTKERGPISKFFFPRWVYTHTWENDDEWSDLDVDVKYKF